MSCRSDDRTPTPCHPPCQDGLYSLKPPLPCWPLHMSVPVEFASFTSSWKNQHGRLVVVMFLRDGLCLRSWCSATQANPTFLTLCPAIQFSVFQFPVLSIWVCVLTVLVWRSGRALKIRSRQRGLFSLIAKTLQKIETSCWSKVIQPGVSSLSHPQRQGSWGDFRFWNPIVMDCMKCPPPYSPFLLSGGAEGQAE